MNRWSLVTFCLSAGLCAAQDSYGLAPELLTLAKIKVRMNETLSRQPNYTCVEQIERARRKAPKFRYELVDNVRLEVALVDGHEMFAWPGSAKFEEHELDKLVPAGGAIGNGNFALFARTVFESNMPTFQYAGIIEREGRRLHRYDYRVPQMLSGFRIRVSGKEATVGFHGSFWADTDSLDVWRLEVIADDIPPILGLTSSSTTVDYVRSKIGQSEFLLPSSSELVMTQINGVEERNRMRFSACRQYTGESVLKFGEPSEPATAMAEAPVTKTEVAIPAGISFELELDSEIDSRLAMVGDVVRGTLTKDLRVKKEVLMPKGASASGRIIRLERKPEYCLLDLQFFDLEADHLHAAISASIEHQGQVSPPMALHRTTPRVTLEGSTGVISQTGDRLKLPRGHRVRLITAIRDTSHPTVRD